MAEAQGERRALGFWACSALVVGNTIGMGIFVLPASLAPFGLNALSGWVITIVGCTLIAGVFAQLARTFPQDDGPYAYTQRAFGDGVAFMVLWCYWISVWVTNATLAIGIVAYLTSLVPALRASSWLPALIALAILWAFVLINLRGIRTAAWVQMGITALKLAPQLAILLLGAWQLAAHPQAYVAHLPPNPPSMREVLAASTLALFAMLGVESATIPAGRVRDPGRTIPRATIAGTLITALVYLGISAIAIFLIPQRELAASSAPFADLFGHFLGAQYGQVLAAFVIVSGIGCLNGWTLIAGELTQTFAARGRLPRVLARVNSRTAPAPALVVTGALASVMLLMSYTDSLAGAFTFLSVVVTAACLPLYFTCSLALVLLWRRGAPSAPRSRVLLWPAAALLAGAYCVWAVIGMGAKPLLWAIVLTLAGALFHIVSALARRWQPEVQ